MDASRACAVVPREATARRRAGYLPTRPWLAWQARRGTLVCTGPAAWKGRESSFWVISLPDSGKVHCMPLLGFFLQL